MARGERILSPVFRSKRKSSESLRDRNECMVHRYYYYAYLKKKHYTQCLILLHTEFYLSEPTIINILTQNISLLNEIISWSPTLKDLSDRYDHWQWR